MDEKIENFILNLPDERKHAFMQLRDTIKHNIPKGFEEQLSNNMVEYVVPHSIFPGGYHANPKAPLPFISIASQKNYISLYHMGLYADNELKQWFLSEYPKFINGKPDMGKGCIRFKKSGQIPYDLLAQLVSKVSVNQWIEKYLSIIG
ncbi:MAG: DUF1801 domain-containing protein [Bacteroidales bacterium]|nr:DUF1801 domain-containing protein [Bacteroidales bacterium]HOY40066.1 DUF1801 domain-containing protein [Bacteroidales bacterium]HQP03318.1 DUF1801 domain-containing protein [Bacteroidales bacterium]